MIRRQAGIAQKLLPVANAGQLALIEGGAIGPVKWFETLLGQAGDAQQVGPGRSVGWSSQNNSIVEDHRAQSQSSSPKHLWIARPCNVESRTPASIVAPAVSGGSSGLQATECWLAITAGFSGCEENALFLKGHDFTGCEKGKRCSTKCQGTTSVVP